jgi:hemerythrin-like domain-containing protein
MTSVDTRERPDIHEMVVVHRLFRREAALLPRLVESVTDGDTKRAALIAGHYRDYQHGLHHHHSGEDELLWPLLLARVDLEAEIVLRMEAQHEVIAASLTEVDGAIGAWETAPSMATVAPVLTALRAHLAALNEHLTDEEEHLLPLAAEHVTVAEWARLGERFVQQTPKNKILLYLGSILEEATPEERAAMLANLPAPARALWHLVGRHQYARRIARIRAGVAASG